METLLKEIKTVTIAIINKIIYSFFCLFLLIKGIIIGAATDKNATEFKPFVKILPVCQTVSSFSRKYPLNEDSKKKFEITRFNK